MATEPTVLAVKIVTSLISQRIDAESSTSSSSSDEEWMCVERRRRQFRPRINNYCNLVDRYSDNEFKTHFRMSRDTFQHLNNILHNDLIRHTPGCPTIPPRQQLLIAIWKMATMDSYRSICDRFNVGRATALRAVRRVTHGLFVRAENFIQWPTGDRAADVMRGFKMCSGFPKIIGAVDGTHIRIDAPKTNHADYVNRKGFHSIQLQLVCDHKYLITHCYAGHPGSVHDQRVFRLSEVGNYLDEDVKFPDDSHILGDAAYELHQHLLSPFRDNGHLTERQKKYNYCHSVARVTVERCIGLLKGRMRSLLHCLPMSRVDLMAEYIVTCCVIHNICTARGDEIVVATIPALSQQNVENVNVHQERRNAGLQKRDIIINTLWNQAVV